MKNSAINQIKAGGRGGLRTAVLCAGIGCLGGVTALAGDGEAANGSGAAVGNKLRFVKHLVKSHTVDVVKSPLSTVGDLATFVTGTGVSWVERLDIRLRRAPIANRKPIPETGTGRAMDLGEWNEWLDRHVLLPETGGEIDFLIGGSAYYDRLESAIASASESIQMQTYIFDNDDVAVGIADMLREKSASVDVSLLYDGMGTIVSHGAQPETLPAGHQAPGSMHTYLKRGESNVKVRRIHNRWLGGDHIKSTIIDSERAFVGGMNIGREYRHDWHDMMFEMRGPVVKSLEAIFKDGWRRAGRGDLELLMRPFRKKAPTSAAKGIHLLQTVPGRTEIADSQLEAIRRAGDYIYIENAYFSDDMMVHELCKARKRGVDVRVIIPNRGNHGIMETSNKLTVNKLIRNGVKVYSYPGMAHIKAAVFDGWACFGTANYDKMSLQVNRELNVATSDPETVDRLLNELFFPDMEASSEVTEVADVRFVEHLVELIADEA